MGPCDPDDNKFWRERSQMVLLTLTEFVCVFLERHWAKLISSIRNYEKVIFCWTHFSLETQFHRGHNDILDQNLDSGKCCFKTLTNYGSFLANNAITFCSWLNQITVKINKYNGTISTILTLLLNEPLELFGCENTESGETSSLKDRIYIAKISPSLDGHILQTA